MTTETISEQMRDIPTYTVTDDVKTKEGEWVEFNEVEVVKKSDILSSFVKVAESARQQGRDEAVEYIIAHKGLSSFIDSKEIVTTIRIEVLEEARITPNN